jgi:prevent-host-death family protein
MTTVNVHEAKTHLSKLLQRAACGEEIIIAKAGKPIAVLGPLPKPVGTRVPGRYRGQIVIHPNFDDPIEEFEEYF